MEVAPKEALAEFFEGVAAQAVADRGPPVVKAGRGKARLLKTIPREAFNAPTLRGVEPTGVVTHGEVLTGVAHVAALEIATQDGKRPEWIACSECGAPRKVRKTGVVPTKCTACLAPRCTVCGATVERRIRLSGKRLVRCAEHPWTSEERGEKMRRENEARTPEQRSALGRKAAAARTPEQRREAWEARRTRST